MARLKLTIYAKRKKGNPNKSHICKRRIHEMSGIFMSIYSYSFNLIFSPFFKDVEGQVDCSGCNMPALPRVFEMTMMMMMVMMMMMKMMMMMMMMTQYA